MNLGRSAGVTVRLDSGPVRGYVVQVGSHAVYAFWNIPYAKPPVGNLRFQVTNFNLIYRIKSSLICF